MTTHIAPTLYTEVRLNVENTSSTSVLHISTEGSSLFGSRKPSRPSNSYPDNEDDYLRQNIATESSIFFRSKDRSPRNILWRVLNDRKVLELQSVDLVQSRSIAQESLLTISLSFKNPIRHNGIAFADSKTHDALEVFVLSTSNELFTFSFRKDLLLRSHIPSNTADFDPSVYFKSMSISALTFRTAYKLIALTDLELLISLHDGGILRLDRQAGDSGASWRETFFHDDGGWGASLKGLIPWRGQNTLRYQGVEISQNATTAFELSPDGGHVISICLDNTIKSWNLNTGKVGCQIDLVEQMALDGLAHRGSTISPDQDSILKIINVEARPDGDQYYFVVYSPSDQQFKFYGVRDADAMEHGIHDLRPEMTFTPPFDELMDTNVWQLADFDVYPGPCWKNSSIWIRARLGAVCRIFTLTFDLLGSSDDLEYAWKHQWVSVSDGSLGIDNLTSSKEFKHLYSDSALDCQNASQKWLEYLNFPGRFDSVMLETALSIFSKGTKVGHNNQTTSLQERLVAIIPSQVQICQREDGQADYNKYYIEVANQWRNFFGLVKHLHTRRCESLSLVLDTYNGLCWSVRAQQVSPIRSCSEIEVYNLNEGLILEQDDEWILNSMPLADFVPNDLALATARVCASAKAFRAGLSMHFNHSFSQLAVFFALKDAKTDVGHHKSRKQHTASLQQLYEQCNFSNEVGDDDFAALTESMQQLGGIGQIENNIFEAIFLKLSQRLEGQQRDFALLRYGDKATIRDAQDILLEGKELLLDILALVTFVSQDLESDELAKGFKPGDLYAALVLKLREYEVLLWMASHVRKESTVAKRRADQGGNSTKSNSIDDTSLSPIMTILESIFIGDWSSMSLPDQPLTQMLVYASRAWTFGCNLSVEYDGVTAHVMSNLIKQKEYTLAQDFSKFLPHNSWTTYLRGRLYLAQGQYAYAASSFRQAAPELSKSVNKKVRQIDTFDTANLLQATERDLFNNETCKYFMHCASLFENDKLSSWSADFATLALDEIDNNETLSASLKQIDNKKRNSIDSPVAARVGLAMQEISLLKIAELREDILSRLFSGSLHTRLYYKAFDALAKFSNPALKHSSLTQLLTFLMNTSPSTLLSLPFTSDLVIEADTILANLTRKQLQSKKSSSTIVGKSTFRYTSILYTFRIKQDNYRGAAECLWEELQIMKEYRKSRYYNTYQPQKKNNIFPPKSLHNGHVSKLNLNKDPIVYDINTSRLDNDNDDDGDYDMETEDQDEDVEEEKEDDELLTCYLLLINILSCCGKEEAWILAEPVISIKHGHDKEKEQETGKRIIVTIDDVRKEYQDELDRRSEVDYGRFTLF